MDGYYILGRGKVGWQEYEDCSGISFQITHYSVQIKRIQRYKAEKLHGLILILHDEQG